MKVKCAVRHFTQLVASAASLRRPGAAVAGGGARSALGFVRGSLVAPVDELAGFTAVPRLGLAGVHAPAAQLTRLRASAAHARLGRVERAYQGFSFGYGFSFSLISFTLSVDQRFQMFHSEGHVPVKRANGHLFPDESRQVDLTDDALRVHVPLLSRIYPPLHRHVHVYFNPVRAAAVAGPNVVVRGSYSGRVAFCVARLVVLGTFAPEIEREPAIRVHAVAFVVAVPQLQLRIAVALQCGAL
jgi:hypothetical protein